MRQLITSTLLAAVAVLVLPFAAAQAKGVPFKGRLIKHASVKLIDTTGNCSCLDKWFTVGLTGGTVEIDAGPTTHGGNMSPTFGIRVRVYDGNRFVKFGQIGCLAKQKTCNSFARLRFHAKHAVYYIMVEGLGADTIAFQLTVHGGVRPLRCGRTCN